MISFRPTLHTHRVDFPEEIPHSSLAWRQNACLNEASRTNSVSTVTKNSPYGESARSAMDMRIRKNAHTN